ncbi:MAG TPA: two-component regulator propeller domain-containing protein, partial [Steroidobacteraceae bacterium]
VIASIGYGALLFDRDGNLWLGGSAVRRLAPGALDADLSDEEMAHQIEVFQEKDGLTGSDVRVFLEDREGNIWACTSNGVDRFTRSNVVRIPVPQLGAAALVAGETGAVWAAVESPSDEGFLLEIRDGIVLSNRRIPYFTHGYRAVDGGIWFAGTQGLARLDGGQFVVTPLPEQARNAQVQAVVRDREGAMWVSLVRRGVFRLLEGQWTLNGDLSSLPHLPAIVETADARGNLWLGYTNNRIARVDGQTVQLYGAGDGLNVGNITAIDARRSHIWIGGEMGLARFDGRGFSRVTSRSGDPFLGISGLVETAAGDLWLYGNAGVVHVTPAEVAHAVQDPAYRVHCEVFDYLDGVPGATVQLRPTPSAIEGSDGRLWFGSYSGIFSIDATRIRRNSIPPPVTIWSLSSRGIRYPAVPANDLRLPINTTNLQIEYTAGSLTIPERVRFRYKLEGSDRDWQDAGSRRDAFYTNLGPGRFTFRVIASNNDGVWNDTGAWLSFSIAPAFYQTKWFYALCALMCLVLLVALYKIRLRQVSAHVRGRLEERLAERERIARELHDTLLQGIQGLVLRFQAVANRIPAREPARAQMERALERADQVLSEGRERVKDLRGSIDAVADLPEALAAAGNHLAIAHPTTLRARIEGTRRELHPIVREEALLIAREALANAFLHADAGQIEIEVSYGETALHVRVRDDGNGIDPHVLSAGRPGHWGLLGMRERAKKIQAVVIVWSRVGSGTEVDLRVPAAMAYRKPLGAGPRRWWRALSPVGSQECTETQDMTNESRP